jgi:hypothetical protein
MCHYQNESFVSYVFMFFPSSHLSFVGAAGPPRLISGQVTREALGMHLGGSEIGLMKVLSRGEPIQGVGFDGVKGENL